jgi:hypothetical protein
MREAAIALVMLAALAEGAQASTREDVLSGIARCSAINDDRAWLNCLYGAAQPMRSQLGLPPAPASQTSLVPPASPASPRFSAPAPVANAPKEKPGFFSRLLGGEPIITDVKLNDYYFNSKGFFVVTLANGQIWEQLDGPRPPWRGPASQYAVSISKGAIGSFNLTVADESDLYKVRRIR